MIGTPAAGPSTDPKSKRHQSRVWQEERNLYSGYKRYRTADKQPPALGLADFLGPGWFPLGALKNMVPGAEDVVPPCILPTGVNRGEGRENNVKLVVL